MKTTSPKTALVYDKASFPQPSTEVFDEYEEEPEAPDAIPSFKRKLEKQNAPPPGAHNCYVGCPCMWPQIPKSDPGGSEEVRRVQGRLRHQAKLARRAERHFGRK